MRTYRNILLLAGLLWLGACQENELKPLHQDDKAPAALAEATVLNLPGAVRLSYQLPADDDLLYVKAEVELEQGKVLQSKASIYSPDLLLEGFGQSKPYEVKLYAVDRSENMSAPITLTVHPLDPPVQSVFASLQVRADFGGISVDFRNTSKANLAFVIMTRDETGEWVERDVYYTKKEGGYFSSRGFAATQQDFLVFLKDRWGNHSDSSVHKLTPLFEEAIAKAKFKTYNLPGDTWEAHASVNWTVNKMWDGETQGSNLFHTKPNAAPFPLRVTFDMGQTAVLSRFVHYGRHTAPYNLGNARTFEIWGTAQTPSPDGEWTGWTKLLDCESVKPSGQPVGTNTAEDTEAYLAGEEFIFPPGTPPVRYIRFKTLSTWGGVTYVHINELSFFGQVQ
ncbi:MAG: DUF5000 domain-containing lipoprotein [Adhaeribacter sp.]